MLISRIIRIDNTTGLNAMDIGSRWSLINLDRLVVQSLNRSTFRLINLLPLVLALVCLTGALPKIV